MKSYITVVGVVQHKDKILLLRRTMDRKVYPGLWQPVTGAIKNHEAVEDAVLREVKEETCLDGEIIKAGEIFEMKAIGDRNIILTFLVKVNSTKVTIDPKEHIDFRWVLPIDYDAVKCHNGVKEDLLSLGLL